MIPAIFAGIMMWIALAAFSCLGMSVGPFSGRVHKSLGKVKTYASGEQNTFTISNMKGNALIFSMRGTYTTGVTQTTHNLLVMSLLSVIQVDVNGVIVANTTGQALGQFTRMFGSNPIETQPTLVGSGQATDDVGGELIYPIGNWDLADVINIKVTFGAITDFVDDTGSPTYTGLLEITPHTRAFELTPAGNFMLYLRTTNEDSNAPGANSDVFIEAPQITGTKWTGVGYEYGTISSKAVTYADLPTHITHNNGQIDVVQKATRNYLEFEDILKNLGLAHAAGRLFVRHFGQPSRSGMGFRIFNGSTNMTYLRPTWMFDGPKPVPIDVEQ